MTNKNLLIRSTLVGGKSSKSAKKLGYNVKCNKSNVYERKNFCLRANMEDASFLRSNFLVTF